MQFDYSAGALLLRINHAGIEGAGIDVQAHRALVEITGIVNPVHGLQRIHGAGLARIHFDRVGGFELAGALLEVLRNRAVVLEEGWEICGVGAQVVDYIQRDCFDDLDAPVVRIHQADVPMPYAKNLERAAKPDAAKTVAAVKKVMYLE